MLIRSSFPMPIKGFLHNISDPAMLQMCPKCDEDPPGGCGNAVSVMEEKRNPNGLCSLSDPKSTKESSLGAVSKYCVPNFVYKRKNRCAGPENVVLGKAPVDMKRVGDSCSTICSIAPPISEKEASAAPRMRSLVYAKAADGCGPNEMPIQAHKIIDVDSVNESCSSKSNTEIVAVALKVGTEESGECSSSSVIAIEDQEDTPLNGRDFCISILRNEGLLERSKSSTSCAFEDGKEVSTSNSYRGGTCECKSCGHSEITRKMLICDSCDEAFHLICCNSRMRSFRGDDEWFCASCLTKKHILVRQTSNIMRLTWTGAEVDRSRFALAAEELNLICLMLGDTGSYKTDVRVGKGFQADVPDWTGPVKGDDMFGEPEELDTSVHSNLHAHGPNRSPRLSSIGNWLQCKRVIDEGGETICGKWRRAPLFEVQTDDWECFCSVFWDPGRADCAVPQEVDTDQVLKQLKYIELLRPRLASKRRKLVQPEAHGSEQLIRATKNT